MDGASKTSQTTLSPTCLQAPNDDRKTNSITYDMNLQYHKRYMHTISYVYNIVYDVVYNVVYDGSLSFIQPAALSQATALQS